MMACRSWGRHDPHSGYVDTTAHPITAPCVVAARGRAVAVRQRASGVRLCRCDRLCGCLVDDPVSRVFAPVAVVALRHRPGAGGHGTRAAVVGASAGAGHWRRAGWAHAADRAEMDSAQRLGRLYGSHRRGRRCAERAAELGTQCVVAVLGGQRRVHRAGRADGATGGDVRLAAGARAAGRQQASPLPTTRPSRVPCL